MIEVLIIAMAGSCGALLRYACIRGIAAFGLVFPWATLLVNVSGCFLAGVVLGFFSNGVISGSTRMWLMVGFLGAYTTMSAFAAETVDLIESGQVIYALGNGVATVFGCLLAIYLGRAIAGGFCIVFKIF